MEQRRMQGLCFRCGDKYAPGHQCRRQLLLLEGEEEAREVEEEEVPPEEEGEEKMEISLHALRGVVTSKIIKVEGRVSDSSLMILIDSGSTHSFLDEEVAKKLRCQLTGTQPLSVTVANGQKVLCKSACVGFCWQMQGESFEADLRLLKLGGCDMVLGVDWMREVSHICFDFNKLEVTFEREEER